jgi:hypothetical protein
VVLLSALTFFVINAAGAILIGARLTHDDVLSVVHARSFWAVGLAVTAFFAGQAGAMGLWDAYVRGRVQLPPQAASPALTVRAQTPWRSALWGLCTWGVFAAAISCWLVPRLLPHGVPLMRFVWLFASGSAALSAVIVWQRTGVPFLQQARLEPRQRRFAGSIDAYVWRRHVLPQALVNAVINALIGAAIMPAALDAGATQPLIPVTFVQLDLAGAAWLLSLLIAVGVRGQVQLDQLCGVVSTGVRSAPRSGRYLAAFALVTALYCVTTGVGIRPIGVTSYLVARTLVCTLVSAMVAHWAARRALYRAAPATNNRSEI